VQIGQIILTLPNAYSKVGLVAALPLSIGCAAMSLWTMNCLIALYVERKAKLVSPSGMVNGFPVVEFCHICSRYTAAWA
jgi:amino acid permease